MTSSHASRAPSPSAETVAKLLHTYARVTELSDVAYQTRIMERAACSRLAQLNRYEIGDSTIPSTTSRSSPRRERQHIARINRVFDQTLHALYQHPNEARARIDEAIRQHGIETTADRIRTAPQEFGILHSARIAPYHMVGTLPASPRAQRDPIPLRAIVAIDPQIRTLAYMAADSGRQWAQRAIGPSVAAGQATDVVTAAERADRTHHRFERTLASVYAHPSEVRQTFESLAREQTVEQAVIQLREAPGRFGQIRSTYNVRNRSASIRVDRTSIESATIDRIADRGRAAITARYGLETAVAIDHQRQLTHTFRQHLERMYETPSVAEARFFEYAQTHRINLATAHMREAPEHFGTLRSATSPMERHRVAAGAGTDLRSVAASAADVGRDVIIARATANAEQLHLLSQRDYARMRHRLAHTELAMHPIHATLAKRIGVSMQQLGPRELQQLTTLVSRPQLMLAQRFAHEVQIAVLGIDRER